MMSPWIKFTGLLLISIFAFWSGATAQELSLNVNEGKLYRLGDTVQDILITNPDIADIQLTQSNSLFVYGKKPGRTQIVALAAKDRVLFSKYVTVSHNLAQLKKLISEQLLQSDIDIQLSAGRLMVSGPVSNSAIMANVVSLANGYLGEGDKLVNNLVVASPLQVNLRVRIMEMNRIATKNIGINWDVLLNPGALAINVISGRSPILAGGKLLPGAAIASGGSSTLLGMAGDQLSVNAVIDALVEDKLVTVLAEPNLTSRSGESANFFAGGEFPIPVAATDNGITVEFKKFGVILDMTPTVISENRIRLHIRPEVSELTSVGAVKINSITIPGISVRRTEATIELASGQSFAVAGLLRNQKTDLIKEVPWLGQLDILGPLFRSKEYQKSETELVIIATVNVVKPLSKDAYLSPAEQQVPPGSGEKSPHKLVQNRTLSSEIKDIRSPDGLKLYGPRGYIY